MLGFFQGMPRLVAPVASLHLFVDGFSKLLYEEARSMLVEVCPRLETLHINLTNMHQDRSLTQLFGEMISHTKRLRKFVCRVLHLDDVLQVITRNHGLRILNVGTLADDGSPPSYGVPYFSTNHTPRKTPRHHDI
jgi:hypothetical protein